MYFFRTDHVAFTDAAGPEGDVLTLGGAHGRAGRPPGVSVVEADLGIRLALVRQVHGRDVVAVGAENVDQVAQQEADAMVTATPGIGLAVRVADCVPVLFADWQAGMIGAAHAGRVGLAAGVLQATVVALRERGATDLQAWIGPHICGQCYEVPPEMAHDIALKVPDVASVTRAGTTGLDLGRGAAAVLHSLGVEVQRVHGCTHERADLHSHRRSPDSAGRQAGIIWLPS